ncbi:hypothetical protein DIPPA_33920 [Diplonema papillatum]|nr:hypothetical protein DIPPA_33920 [Diplonema papillatum]
MPGESTTSSGGTRADGGAEEAVEVAKSEAAEPDIQGEWCYVSTLTGVPHVFEVARGGGGGGLVWREGDVQGDLAGVTEETEHGLFDADWTTRPGGVNGRLWIKSVGDGPLQMLETLFRKADTPPIHETAARKDNRLVGTWRYTSSTTGTEHAYTIFPTKGVLEWRESGLSGKVSHVPEGKPSNPAYTFKVDLHDGEALWLSLEAGAPQPRLRSLYCETPETAGICEVASQHDGPPDFVTVGTPVQFWDGGGASKGPDQKWVAGKLVCMNADGTYEVKGLGFLSLFSSKLVRAPSVRRARA